MPIYSASSPPAGIYRLPVYAYMRIVVCIACRVQLRGAIFLALAGSRICAAPNCRSLLIGGSWRGYDDGVPDTGWTEVVALVAA